MRSTDMRLIARLLSVLDRWTRWSEGHVFAITPEQIGIVEGIRASVAISVMLSAALLLHTPDLAWGAVAAFWTCLCDPGGQGRSRLRVFATFAVGGTFVITVASYGAHGGPLFAGPTLFLLVFLCGLTRTYGPTFGPMPAQIGFIAAIATVIGVASPRPITEALELGGCFLFGSVWAGLLCAVLWRTRPQTPARRALIAVFVRLGEMVRTLQTLHSQPQADLGLWTVFNGDHRRAVRIQLERSREAVARLPTGRTHLSQGIDAAGHIFAALIALGHYRVLDQVEFDLSVEGPLLESLHRLIEQTIQEADKVAPETDALYAGAEALMNEARRAPGIASNAIAVAAGSLVDLARHWREPDNDMAAGGADAPHQGPSIPPTVWRHALRVSTAVSLSYVVGIQFDVTFSYWGTIATLVIMQPFGANTWLRVLERAVGSMIGGLLAAILIARLSEPPEMLLFIALLSAAVIALRLVNYALFMIFLTPMFMLLSDFIHPASGLISARIINEIIGACIGLSGSLLFWPEKEREVLADAVSAAISANMAFASGVLRTDIDISNTLDQTRREAGLASGRAETARQRMRLEGRSRALHLDRTREVLMSLRAICGAATVFAVMRQAEGTAGDDGRADRYDGLSAILRSGLSGADIGSALASLPVSSKDDLDQTVLSLVLAVQDFSIEARRPGHADERLR